MPADEVSQALPAEGGTVGRPAFRYDVGVEQGAVPGLQSFVHKGLRPRRHPPACLRGHRRRPGRAAAGRCGSDPSGSAPVVLRSPIARPARNPGRA